MSFPLLPCIRHGLTSKCGPVQELVQVESLAQVGVQLLLFTLGLEFSLSKLRAVRSVALLGAPLSQPWTSLRTWVVS